MFAKPFSNHPLEVAARRLYLHTLPSQPDDILINWLMRESDPEIIDTLWDQLGERLAQA